MNPLDPRWQVVQDEVMGWSERLGDMFQDARFMAWLEAYDPDWRLEYTELVLARWDAFQAGRQAASSGKGKRT